MEFREKIDKMFDTIRCLPSIINKRIESFIPSGGTQGQVLSKKSDNDYDFEWSGILQKNDETVLISGTVNLDESYNGKYLISGDTESGIILTNTFIGKDNEVRIVKSGTGTLTLSIQDSEGNKVATINGVTEDITSFTDNKIYVLKQIGDTNNFLLLE